MVLWVGSVPRSCQCRFRTLANKLYFIGFVKFLFYLYLMVNKWHRKWVKVQLFIQQTYHNHFKQCVTMLTNVSKSFPSPNLHCSAMYGLTWICPTPWNRYVIFGRRLINYSTNHADMNQRLVYGIFTSLQQIRPHGLMASYGIELPHWETSSPAPYPTKSQYPVLVLT